MLHRISGRPSGFSSGPSSGGGSAAAAPDVDPKGMTLAARMMEKMGWKVGQAALLPMHQAWACMPSL
jgi:hypothetical protein